MFQVYPKQFVDKVAKICKVEDADVADASCLLSDWSKLTDKQKQSAVKQVTTQLAALGFQPSTKNFQFTGTTLFKLSFRRPTVLILDIKV